MKSRSEIENEYCKPIRKLKTNVKAGSEIEIENEYEKRIRNWKGK
jgi:hypothetical protein